MFSQAPLSNMIIPLDGAQSDNEKIQPSASELASTPVWRLGSMSTFAKADELEQDPFPPSFCPDMLERWGFRTMCGPPHTQHPPSRWVAFLPPFAPDLSFGFFFSVHFNFALDLDLPLPLELWSSHRCSCSTAQSCRKSASPCSS